MGTIASQITSLTIVYSTVYSDADQRKHQSSASLAFVWGIHRGPVNSPHKWPVTRKMFPFDDVIMNITTNITDERAFVQGHDYCDYPWLNHQLITFTLSRTLRWRHDERLGVSNHQPHDCLLNRWYRCRSKNTSKLLGTGLWGGNSPVIGEFPAQRASNAENVSIWWRHHGYQPLLSVTTQHMTTWTPVIPHRHSVQRFHNVLLSRIPLLPRITGHRFLLLDKKNCSQPSTSFCTAVLFPIFFT